jgi:hypothetical protein
MPRNATPKKAIRRFILFVILTQNKGRQAGGQFAYSRLPVLTGDFFYLL